MKKKSKKINISNGLIGFIFISLGLVCFLIKLNSVDYIDANGILHEKFFLIPIGYIFIFSGMIVLLYSLFKFLISTICKFIYQKK